VNLRKREVRVLEMDLLGAPAIRLFVENDFQNLRIGAGNPSHTVVIDFDPRSDRGCHLSRLP
jgi:hypothetical protein